MESSGVPPGGAGASGLASGAGHALNNVLAYLYAAASYLEDGEVDAPRARAAVEDACRGARALSAALTLHAITAEGLATVPAFGQLLDDAGLAGALRGAVEVAGASAADDAALLVEPHAATLDADTLAALALCAATALRRSAGVAAVLGQRATLLRDPGSGVRRLTIRWQATLPAGRPAPRRPAHGPCEAALAHAAALLPRLDAALRQAEDGTIDLRVDLREASPADGRWG